MSLEAGLAYAHLLAILSLIVFLSSEAALCRAEWMNEAVVRRLGRLDLIYGLSALAVLLTGLARIYLGMKGSAWYWGNPWLHAKLALLVVIGALSIQPTRMFIRWRARAGRWGRLAAAAAGASGASPGDVAGAPAGAGAAGRRAAGARFRLMRARTGP